MLDVFAGQTYYPASAEWNDEISEKDVQIIYIGKNEVLKLQCYVSISNLGGVVSSWAYHTVQED